MGRSPNKRRGAGRGGYKTSLDEKGSSSGTTGKYRAPTVGYEDYIFSRVYSDSHQACKNGGPEEPGWSYSRRTSNGKIGRADSEGADYAIHGRRYQRRILRDPQGRRRSCR